jgi:hypothetical protein
MVRKTTEHSTILEGHFTVEKVGHFAVEWWGQLRVELVGHYPCIIQSGPPTKIIDFSVIMMN